MLEKNSKEIEIVGEADGVKTGFDCIQKNEPELVLLDVEMGDGTGFDLLSLFEQPKFTVIFITAHDGYAIKAFQFSAVGYVLKPIETESLLEAIEKAKSQKELIDSSLSIETLLQNRKSALGEQKLILSDVDNVYLVSVEEISRCQSESNYTRFFLVDGNEILIAKTMKEYVKLLEDNGFFRVHRSHLINLSQLDRIDRKSGGIVYMKDNSQVPIATRRKEVLLETLKRL